MQRNPRPRSLRRLHRRRGVALIEFAIVAVIFFMFLFAIIEYARLIFVRQVLINAAREGARYAVVNTTAATMVSDTEAYVLQKLAGVNTLVSGYQFQIYRADSTGENVGSATAVPFGQLIAVQLDCDFQPLLPSLLLMDKSVHLTSKALMYSEAN